MASSFEDSLYQEARSIAGPEFESWLGTALQVFLSKDRSNYCLSHLRQLMVLTTVSKYNRNLPSAVFRCLRSICLEPEQGPVRFHVLAAAILRELSPLQKIIIRDFVPPTDIQNVPFIIPVLLSQSNIKDQSVFLFNQVMKWLSHPSIEEELYTSALSALHTLCSHSSIERKITEEQVDQISSHYIRWLKQASRNSLSVPSAGISIFSSGAKKQSVPVKEIDGSISSEIFTILNIGDFYFSDQLLNIQTFSTLRRWILFIHSQPIIDGTAYSPTLSPIPDQEPGSPHHNPSSQSTTPICHTPTSSLSNYSVTVRPEIQGIYDVILQYCIRVIGQCERKPLKTSDDDLIRACLCEVVSLLDLVCTYRKRMIHDVFPTLKSLYTRVSNEEGGARVSLAIVKFLVTHSDTEMYSYDNAISKYFGETLAIKYNDSGISYDAIDFCVTNMTYLCVKTNLFTKYFPCLLKVLAWYPITFISEFLLLLPTFISETTAPEVMHSLLDLPCLSAILTANYILSNVPAAAVDSNFLPQYSKCFSELTDPNHKLMYGHFLRNESGRGDTIDRLGYLHETLEEFKSHQRVEQTGQAVPLLLSVYFKVVLHEGKKELVSDLLAILIERVLCLYNNQSFQDEIRKVMADQLLAIFKTYPSLLIDHSNEIIDFLSNLRIPKAGGSEVYLHLVWVVGEYAHSSCDPRCSASHLSTFFETLEMIGYEIALHLCQQNGYTVRLMVVLMSTLAKLASRCQDLIPRALLCLNKIVNQGIQNVPDQTHRRLLLGRMNELSNVLKMPSVASAVLTPPINSCDPIEVAKQMNIATLMQSTVDMIAAN